MGGQVEKGSVENHKGDQRTTSTQGQQPGGKSGKKRGSGGSMDQSRKQKRLRRGVHSEQKKKGVPNLGDLVKNQEGGARGVGGSRPSHAGPCKIAPKVDISKTNQMEPSGGVLPCAGKKGKSQKGSKLPAPQCKSGNKPEKKKTKRDRKWQGQRKVTSGAD